MLAAELRKYSNVPRLRSLPFHRVSAIRTTISFMSLLDTDGPDAYYLIAGVVNEALGHHSTLGSTKSIAIARGWARILIAGLTKDDHGNWSYILTFKKNEIDKLYCGFLGYIDSHFPVLYQKYVATFDQLRVPEAMSTISLPCL
jgi:hypothetical protein